MNYDQIEHWLNKMYILNFTINSDLSVDVNGHVIIDGRSLEEIPIQFGKVYGSFGCSSNRLTSLKGSPKEVGGYFNCSFNQLTSLEHSPIKVGGGFACTHNNISTIKGCPYDVDGGIDYLHNPLPYVVLLSNNIKIIIKHYEEYGLWNSDGVFNRGRWRIFDKDHRNGLL